MAIRRILTLPVPDTDMPSHWLTLTVILAASSKQAKTTIAISTFYLKNNKKLIKLPATKMANQRSDSVMTTPTGFLRF